MEQGIAGSVASSGRLLNIPDAYENPAFNQSVDKKSGYRTKAILCLPIKCEDVVIGVLQLINKGNGAGFGGTFTTEDEDMMQVFLAIAGPILASSNLYQQIQGKSKTKSDNEMPGATVQKTSAVKPSFSGVEEMDEDEEN